MEDNTLKEYIDKELERGFSKEDIKVALIDVGYDEEAIDSYFEEKETEKSPYSAINKEVYDKSVKRYFVFVLISVIAIGIGIFFLAYANFPEVKDFVTKDANTTVVKTTESKGPSVPSAKDQLEGRIKKSSDLSNIISFSDKNKEEKGEPERFYSKISQEKLDCMYENEMSLKMCRAVILEKKEECVGISKDNEKKACEDLVLLKKSLKDEETCNMMSILPKELCTIVSKEDIVSCEKLASEDMIKTCKELIVLKTGIEKKDSSICNDLDNIETSICTAMTKDDESYCESILSRAC